MAAPHAGPGYIYLASQSPRRRELLAQIGVRHELLLPRADEDAEALELELAGETPDAYVERVTRAKLHAALRRWRAGGLARAPILCADTTVALRRRILGKPRDADDAIATLQQLSGRTHRVLTAVGMIEAEREGAGEREGDGDGDGARERVVVSTSRVRFATMPQRSIEAYVASGEPFGKAGAYAIQSAVAAWITHIEGSYSGIVGLPLFETGQLLREFGVSN